MTEQKGKDYSLDEAAEDLLCAEAEVERLRDILDILDDILDSTDCMPCARRYAAVAAVGIDRANQIMLELSSIGSYLAARAEEERGEP